MNKRCVHNANQMQIRKKINCENKRHLHQSRWAVKCQPRLSCSGKQRIGLTGKVQGEPEQLDRRLKGEWAVLGWWSWKIIPTCTTFGVTGVLFEPVSLCVQKMIGTPHQQQRKIHQPSFCHENAPPPFNQRQPYSEEYMSWADLPMWFGGFWMFPQRQQQNIYKDSKQAHG